MKRNLIYLFLVLSAPLFSQESIILNGIIEADSIGSTSINIVNLTQKTGTTNSPDGTFEIMVKENDTLLFSSVQHEILKVEIVNRIYKERYLRVKLSPAVNELEEVLITDINLTGNLNTDLANIEVFDQADVGFPLKDYRKPTELEGIYRSLSGSPLSLIINTFNGRIKRLERAGKVIKFDQIVDKGINAVPTSFFTTELSIPKNEIIHFVSTCAQNEHFRKIVSEETTLEIIDYYYESAPQFLTTISQD